MAAPQLKTKPSGIHYWEFLDETGARRRVSTNTRDLAKARAMGKDIVLGIAPQTSTQRSRSGDGTVTMQNLFDRAEKTVWAPGEAKSQGTIRSNLKILGRLIGHEVVSAMNYSRLERLVEELRAMGYAPGTIKRKMDMVSKALRMATIWTDDKGRPLLVAKPTMPAIRVANLKDRILERDEELAVFLAIEKRRTEEPGRQWWRFERLIRFLLDTGARLGEALGIGPDDITDLNGRRYVTFARYRTKNDKPRTLPLTAAVSEGLDELGRQLAQRKGAWRYFPISEGTAWYMWDNIREDVKAAGFSIDDVTLHTLRHTCLTRLAQGGMGLLQLQQWAGHSDPKITADRYVHLRPNDLVGGLDILESSNGGTAPIRASDPDSPANVTFTDTGAKRANPGTSYLN
ncbi:MULTISPECIES: tyrosine-type recombinase/integrase [unclassified Sphingomonas]|uniref:tyrosine-type recombinase/integrase n=1 Tax=unclassified Sphingomonas TaxID=196159 RepID=UPI0021506F6B|nr:MULTISPECIES: site-specific integrase [unclassified Sphingomonas]MCR5870648.1 site-specific integrase [Sphingomonas sp. J344]UUY01013.1 site-specific integrase [Sphingomonas sp. J315]